MSKESAKAFVQRFEKDSVLRNRVAALKADDMAGLMKIAGDIGIGTFSKAEYFAACAEPPPMPKGELSNDQLESVAGGMMPPIKRTPWKTCGTSCGC